LSSNAEVPIKVSKRLEPGCDDHDEIVSDGGSDDHFVPEVKVVTIKEHSHKLPEPPKDDNHELDFFTDT
jgi:hypothetical protein